MGELSLAIITLIARDVVAFPVWWYTQGFVLWSDVVWREIRHAGVVLDVGIWLRNLFVPMYGVRDIAGRVMSFVMRLMQIIARSLAYGVVLMIGAGALLVYLLLPIALLGGVGVIVQFML